MRGGQYLYTGEHTSGHPGFTERHVQPIAANGRIPMSAGKDLSAREASRTVIAVDRDVSLVRSQVRTRRVAALAEARADLGF